MGKECVLITGSSSGLGEALAYRFAREKKDLIIHGRNSDNLGVIKEEVLKLGIKCTAVQGDLNDTHTLQVLDTFAREKNISNLINNAAIDSELAFDEISTRDFDEILSTNLLAPISLTRRIYPFFKERRSGTIVNINAVDGLRNVRGKVAYTTSKFGLRGFTDSLRYEAKRSGIRVIGVYLGGMKTPMYGRTGRSMETCMNPADVAEIIYHACANQNSATTDDITIGRTRI